jgi:hypothetical protein
VTLTRRLLEKLGRKPLRRRQLVPSSL